ncbi:uncharacterized protein LOC131663019 [Phymastichus coffea]|uniref:uncharacterized protein LOC131663019 n=1 Tax=Phymastichus coffea TaxID=108790 RepID=UPI00273B1036|nr:uncharacterized protein LOC131663019 [Phymastichus coffea]
MSSNNTNYEAYMNRLDFHEQVRKFTLSLYENSAVPRNEVQSTIEKVGDFISQAHTVFLQKEMDRVMKSVLDDETRSRIHAIFENGKDPLKDFSTEHLRLQNYKKENLFFEPEQFVIELPGIYNSMKEYMQSLENENDLICNITQGTLWKSKYRKDGFNAFPFFLSFDDMQPGNTLGSHASQQKLDMVYGSLPCLPPHLVSKLTNIFLTTIFHSNHRTTFGNSAVFSEIRKELNELATKGLTIFVDGRAETVYFNCLLLIGNNLGLNSCCGFTESFNAYYYCRICNANSDDCKILTVEDESLIRTKKSYNNDLLNQSRGVKEKCIFNDLPKFHITQNHSLDLMHDLFEGIGRDEIEYILTIYILKKKLFTLTELNTKINQFDYGNEKSNKPMPLMTEICKPCDREKLGTRTKVKAKQSAVEMACLIRYLGPILGELIPTSADTIDYWKLYITLRQIVGIVAAPRYAMSDIVHIKSLIHKHHTLYKKLFGNLKPKHHIITHIPRIMLENGPLVHFWAMMFERKHRDFKNVAKNVTCSKDLPYTMGFRNQILLSCKKEFTEPIDIEYKLGSLTDDTRIYCQMTKYFENIISIKSYTFVEMLGNQFKSGTVCVYGINEDEEPTFAKVKHVLKINGDVYLFACSLQYIDFDYKYYAYEVANNETPDTLINMNELCYTPPGIFFVNKKFKCYIATKFDI